MFRRGDEEIRVPVDATMVSRFEGEQYQLSAKDVRDTYVPKGHGFENRMRRLAAREKELREKYGEDNLPLIEGLIEFKRNRLSQLPPEEAEYLRRYLSGDPDVSFSRLQGSPQRSPRGAHNTAYNAPPEPDSDPYGYEEPTPALPPEVLQSIDELRRSNQELRGELQGLKQTQAQRDQEAAAERERERWQSVQSSIDQAVARSPILKKAGKRAAENIMMKYLTLKDSNGELLHDMDLSVRLVEQDVKEEHGRVATHDLDQLLDENRRFETVEPGGIPATSPAQDFPEQLRKMGKAPLRRGGGMSAIGKHVLGEYLEAHRQRRR